MSNSNRTAGRVMLEAFEENKDRIAIRRSNGFPQITYGELLDRAGRVASFLEEKGIEPGKGKRVAICMGRNPEYVVSFMSCLIFGYAAVLLDPEYPESRRSFILKNSSPEFILDEENYSLAMECEAAYPDDAPEEETEAVIVYTSGSTGDPKGIVHSQLSCGMGILNLKDVLRLTPDDVYGSSARFTFAVHCSDLLMPLCSGCSVCLVPPDVLRDPHMMALYCKNHEITATYMPPSLLRTFDRASDTLKTVVSSGEKVFNIDPKGMRVIATYGMSECYVVMAEEIKECSENAYLGKTVGDICAYILDENGNETDEGEICFTGDFFKGYIGLPELTSSLLVDNPFRDRAGDGHEKMFHTRDHVKRLPDGRLVYIDRMDWMVKINGNRVELGEVENILRGLPEVRDVIVKGFSDSQGRVILCAYYISESGKTLSKQYLADRLAEKVPAYMIPPFFVRLDEFPKNANGKLDRKALALPDINEFKNDYAPPENDAEAMLCHAMEHVLETELVGINDDFFDLGGDSLKSAALIAEMEGQGLTYSMIYDGRTPKRIAALIEEAGAGSRTAEMAAEERNRPQPLLPYQQYFLDYQLYSPNKMIATNPICCRLLPETASPEAVKEALDKVFAHFAVFGTVFGFDSKMELVQRCEPELIPETEISYVSEKTFEEVIMYGFVRPFQMFNSLLWRCGIFVTPESTYILMDIHHAISDRAMVSNMFRNIFNALEGKPLDDDLYYLYLREQGDLRANALSHAGEILDGIEETRSYSGFPRPDFEHRGNTRGLYTCHTADTLDELSRTAAHYRCSLNNLIIAAGAAALGEYNDESHVRVGWTYSGREEDWEKTLMGMTIESISTCIYLGSFDSDGGLIQEVKDQSMEGIRYSAFSSAFEDMSPGLSGRMNIVYQNGADVPENAPEGTDISAYFDYLDGTLAMFMIMIYEQSENEPLNVLFVYNRSRYREESVARFAEIFNRKLADFRNIRKRP